MTFTTTLEQTEHIAKIVLSGDLDASTAPAFKAEIEKAALGNPKKLVLLMKDLNYMSSAGLRVLIFAKQKMGIGVDIYVVSPQEMVLDTLEKTGFHHSVIVMKEYDAMQIESV